ncbi:hypothetical protein L218DRAFT_809662, partial [Marasmius fiardii PR-910]
LQSQGVLQERNPFSINDMLNPLVEQCLINEVTPQDIHKAVINTREARENMEITGTDDIAGKEKPVVPKPTRKEVLTTVNILCQYIADINDQFSHSL